MRRFPICFLCLASFAVCVPSAMAGKVSGGTTSPTISIATLNGTTMAASTLSPTPAYQNTVTWATTGGSFAGWEVPEVVLSCFQDVNGDGVVNTDPGGPDIVYSWIDSPGAVFSFSGQGQTSTWSLRGGGPATCRANYDAYGWRSGHSSVRLLASTGNFAVTG